MSKANKTPCPRGSCTCSAAGGTQSAGTISKTGGWRRAGLRGGKEAGKRGLEGQDGGVRGRPPSRCCPRFLSVPVSQPSPDCTQDGERELWESPRLVPSASVRAFRLAVRPGLLDWGASRWEGGSLNSSFFSFCSHPRVAEGGSTPCQPYPATLQIVPPAPGEDGRLIWGGECQQPLGPKD